MAQRTVYTVDEQHITCCQPHLSVQGAENGLHWCVTHVHEHVHVGT